MLKVELKHRLEQPRPAQTHRSLVSTLRFALRGLRSLGALVRPLRHHHRALGVRCRQAVSAHEIKTRPWRQGCNPLKERLVHARAPVDTRTGNPLQAFHDWTVGHASAGQAGARRFLDRVAGHSRLESMEELPMTSSK